MELLPDTFFRIASARLSEYPHLAHSWTGPEKDGKRVLTIPKAEVDGFEVRIECETYGLYPFAGEWHGAPWDAPHTKNVSNEEVCEDCFGFVRSLLCEDATLTVLVASGRPYKWILSYPWGTGRANDKTNLIFFNYFGKREKAVYQNRHLLSRENELQPTSA